MTLNKNIKIIIKWVAVPVLAAWLFYSLYRQVQAQPNLDKAIALIKQAPFGKNAWKFWLTIFLVFVNWGIEARKWQLLIKPVQPMNFFTAFKAVLCGVTLSLNTPNRIGEYGGRVLFVKDGGRLQAVSLSIAGSMAQLIITMLMGCGGLLFVLLNGADIGITPFWVKIFLYGSLAATFITMIFFFRLSWLIKMIDKLPYSEKFSKYISVLESFDAKILLRLLLLSAMRYIVFVLQYIFMLQLMQVEQNWWQGFWLVTLLFWIMAIIPSFAIAELGIRGKVSERLFFYSTNTLGILAVTFGIWFINLFIPALIGSLLILSIKIKKDK